MTCQYCHQRLRTDGSRDIHHVCPVKQFNPIAEAATFFGLGLLLGLVIALVLLAGVL